MVAIGALLWVCWDFMAAVSSLSLAFVNFILRFSILAMSVVSSSSSRLDNSL